MQLIVRDDRNFPEPGCIMMFGEKLPYDMESAVSSFVLDDSTSTKEVMQLSIGQGQTLMSPLHLNMITQAIANGGVVHKATVVDKVTSASGTVLSQTKPEDYRTVMSSEVAQKMQEFMREVVVNGTATKLSTRPYNAAGKTGTAEFSTNTSDSNVWFTGYAYDDSHPKVAVTIIMEKTAGSGGAYAVPAVRDILDTYFGYTPKPGEDDDANFVHVINDHNGDGVPDNAGAAASNADEGSSKDTAAAALNIDTNGDGIMDAIDLNGDGVPDAVDTNGDGIPDTNVGGGATNTSGQNAATAAGAAGTTGAQDNGQTSTETQTNTQNSTAAGAGTQQDTAGVQTTVQQNTTAAQNAGQQNTAGAQHAGHSRRPDRCGSADRYADRGGGSRNPAEYSRRAGRSRVVGSGYAGGRGGRRAVNLIFARGKEEADAVSEEPLLQSEYRASEDSLLEAGTSGGHAQRLCAVPS